MKFMNKLCLLFTYNFPDKFTAIQIIHLRSIPESNGREQAQWLPNGIKADLFPTCIFYLPNEEF